MDYLVDVNIAVYNQAAFLEKTLDDVLEQKAEFPYRILIGDDYSTDGSIEILKRYERKFPDKIVIIYQTKNLGMNSSERNGIILLKKSTAKYIALLDGDDYWTDNLKLQKQVDFMEANPDYSTCYHPVYILNAGGHLERETLNTLTVPHTYTLTDLAHGNIIHTPSVLFRNGLIREFPEWFIKCAAADYVIHMLNAKKGKIYFMPDVMAVYRIHSGGVWSKVNLMYRTEKWSEMLGYLI